MNGLLWFSGITWDTSVRDIGWTWVILAVLVGMAVRIFTSVFKDQP